MNAAQRQWTLVMLKQGQPAQSWPLPEGLSTLGRERTNSIRLADPSVSRTHAEMQCGPEGVAVRDLNSSNGVLVNGVPRQQASLQAGDRLRIGVFELEIKSGVPVLALTPTPALPTEGESRLYDTMPREVSLPENPGDRQLQTLYHFCFWIAEGVEEKDFVPKSLRLLLDSFQAEEAHLYSADGQLESCALKQGNKPAIKFAAFLAERFQQSPEAICVSGASIAPHQRGVGQFNYLVGPLRASQAAEKKSRFLLLLRRAEWEDFAPADRVLLQAIGQLWARGQAKAIQVLNLKEENQRLKEQVKPLTLLGRSAVMEKLREQARKGASTKVTILLQGETGSGKEVVAQFIHESSPRRSEPFIRVNCAAIPDGLIESELFGHVKGAFTDARTDRTGKFAQADNGTLFLDEIGEMPLTVQAKVLRAIENGEIEALGSERVQKINVRIIAATHRDLAEMVRQKEFREDLLYRLKVMALRVPPLRDHPEDILELAESFLRKFCAENGLAEISFTPEAVEKLTQHAWPGNVRELRNVVQRCAVNCDAADITAQAATEAIEWDTI